MSTNVETKIKRLLHNGPAEAVVTEEMVIRLWDYLLALTRKGQASVAVRQVMENLDWTILEVNVAVNILSEAGALSYEKTHGSR